ncbi:MAG: ABC transporter permease [Eubacterium sp.]|nr:ABC transporter permease [Eubacterium sp.]
MKSFSIALKNIKKSKDDYSVYFFTLIIGVSIFYMFNAIGTQGVMEDVSKSTNSSVGLLVNIIKIVSVLVAFVLGLLIIYANNFLIKRRKKEFGIYMLLGMSKKKVSKIIVNETGLVGILSLGVGLVIGIFGSQFLSIIVTKMFEVDVTNYRFTVSIKAIIMTVVSYAVIYLVVFIFNTRTVSRNKLIDLINAEKKSEKQILKNKTMSIILFILAICGLAIALVRIGFYGGDVKRNEFITLFFVGIIGTFVLFWSISGFLQEALSSSKTFYRKGLNSFVIRQFTGNINSSAFSMALITLMLFAALSLFSTGFSIRAYLNKRLGNATPVDVTIMTDKDPVEDVFEEKGLSLNEIMDEYIELPIYESPEITLADTLGEFKQNASETFRAARWESPEYVMGLSDYNKIQNLYDREEIKLTDSQYAVISDFELLNTYNEMALKAGTEIEVGENTLSPAYDKPIEEYMMMSGMTASMGVVVVPDYIIEDEESQFTIDSYFLAGDYKVKTREEKYAVDNRLEETFGNADEGAIDENGDIYYPIMYSTKNQVKDNSVGTSVIVVFIILYIGIVFVIACAAIIALKILSDSIDSTKKFDILKRIGAGSGMRRRAVFAQVLMNFLLPLIFASLYTVFGLRYIKQMLKAFGLVSMGSGIIVTFIIMLIIYGGYFLMTYENCRRIVKA